MNKGVSGEIDSALRECKLFVEATQFEQRCLRERYCKDYAWKNAANDHWVQLNDTFVSFYYAYIGGVKVCFFTPTSRIVNWNDIESAMNMYVSNGNWCTAMNFHPNLVTGEFPCIVVESPGKLLKSKG